MSLTISGTQIAFPDASTQNTAATGFGFKNRIINGAMMIDQRNAGAAVSTDGTYPVDRYKFECSVGSKLSLQQSTTVPAGFKNSLAITVSSAYSSGAGDFQCLTQFIEGFNVADLNWGTANAQPVTVSFWARSSLTGTFNVTLANNAFNRAYVATYSISAANTWEYKTVTVAGDTTGTWETGTLRGIAVRFALGTGSTYGSGTANAWNAATTWASSGTVQLVANAGATLYITGVQLEKGSTATSFDYRPYGTELALCQRYYYMMVSGNSQAIGMGTYYSSSQLRGIVSFPVTMRTAPALAATSGTNYYIGDGAVGDFFNSFTIYNPSTNTAMIYNGSESSGTAGVCVTLMTNSTSSYVAFNSEL